MDCGGIENGYGEVAIAQLHAVLGASEWAVDTHDMPPISPITRFDVLMAAMFAPERLVRVEV